MEVENDPYPYQVKMGQVVKQSESAGKKSQQESHCKLQEIHYKDYLVPGIHTIVTHTSM